MKTKTQKIVTASMLAALCCVATMIIKIPSPLKGYLNLGGPAGRASMMPPGTATAPISPAPSMKCC